MGPEAFGEGVEGDDSEEGEIPSLEQLLADLDAETAQDEVPQPVPQARASVPAQVVNSKERPLSFPSVPHEEELQIPTSRLGDSATIQEVRFLVDRIQTLSSKGLERECRQNGLPWEPKLGRGPFLQALCDIVVWQHLPRSELERECKGKGLEAKAPAVRTNFRGMVPVGRPKEYLPALCEDLRERLSMRIWESQGIPLDSLDDFKACEYLAEQYSVIEAMGMQELLEWYRSLGLPTEQAVSAETIRGLAKHVQLWNCMSWATLRGECECQDVSVEPPEREGEEECEEEGDEHREAVVNRLLMKELLDIWERRGIPASKLGFDACVYLVQKSEEWRVMGSAELRKQCAEMNFPEERGVEKQELVKNLRSMLIWGLLPVAELQNECREQGLPVEKSSWEEDEGAGEEREDDEGELRSQLIQRLMVRRLAAVYERKGIPARQLDAGTVVALYEEFGKLDAMGYQELATKCEEHGIPVSPEATPQELRQLIRQMYTWSSLPEAALRDECRARDLSGRTAAKSHEELLGLLLFDVCRSSFDALGIPTERLGSFANCQQLNAEWSALGGMSSQEKAKSYRNMGFESAPCESELTERLRKVQLWLSLPLKELQKDCRKHNVNSIAKEEDRNELVGLIIWRLWGDGPSFQQHEQQEQQQQQPPPAEWWGQQRPQANPAARAPNWGGKKGGGPAGWGGKGSGRKGGPNSFMPDDIRWSSPYGPGPFARSPPGHFVPPDFSKGQTHGFTSPGTSHRPAGQGQRGGAPEVPESISRHFRLLELPVTAGSEEVRKAYRKLALKCHPDKQQSGSSESSASAEEFHKLTRAQEELTAWLRKIGR